MKENLDWVYVVSKVLTANLMNDRTKRVKWFTSVTDLTINIQSGR